ncbi:unnamed protein product [Rangifer tarandus platyrhynchus]|uniref:Uncharacterized protein n=1 Tax=Rangifer tarandus platyrhynchus TaxID=3082113 RepID=A0AC59ZWE7_RANTA
MHPFEGSPHMAGAQRPHLADTPYDLASTLPTAARGVSNRTLYFQQAPRHQTVMARPTSAQMAKVWRPGSGGRGQRSHQVVLGGPWRPYPSPGSACGLTQKWCLQASGVRQNPWAFREVARDLPRLPFYFTDPA